MATGIKRTVQVAVGLVVLALMLPVSNLLVGTPKGTRLTAVSMSDAQAGRVAQVLERSCASCHVPGVPPPFYAALPLASGIVERDMQRGLDRFDLADGFLQGTDGGRVPEPVLAKIERQIDRGEMPPLSYRAMHWNAGLGREREAVLSWIEATRAAQAAPGVPTPLRSELIRPLPEKITYDPAKAALGRKLYHDKRLSGDDTLSCASCHDLALGGTDNRPVSNGIRGQKGGINSPTTFNAALNFVQFWDGRADTLETQAGGPPLNPVEMGAAGWDQIVVKLNKDKALRKEFEAVYPEGFGQKSITGAIAEFERTLITPNSRFDKFLTGDTAALSDAEKHGYELFKATGCATCHVGELLGGKSYEVMGRHADYFKARVAPLTEADNGRFNVTKKEEDRHAFKVPTLRNVAKTGPWFHDGSKRTLQDAVEAMATYQSGSSLTLAETLDVVRFLETLTGEYDGKKL